MGTLLIVGLGYLWYLNFRDFFIGLRRKKQRAYNDAEVDKILAKQEQRRLAYEIANRSCK